MIELDTSGVHMRLSSSSIYHSLHVSFSRHSRFFIQESAMRQMISSNLPQLHGRFLISKSIHREDDSELWTKVFSMRAGIHRTRPSSGERATYMPLVTLARDKDASRIRTQFDSDRLFHSIPRLFPLSISKIPLVYRPSVLSPSPEDWARILKGPAG